MKLKELTDAYFEFRDKQESLDSCVKDQQTLVENTTRSLRDQTLVLDEKKKEALDNQTNLLDLESKIKNWVDPETEVEPSSDTINVKSSEKVSETTVDPI